MVSLADFGVNRVQIVHLTEFQRAVESGGESAFRGQRKQLSLLHGALMTVRAQTPGSG